MHYAMRILKLGLLYGVYIIKLIINCLFYWSFVNTIIILEVFDEMGLSILTYPAGGGFHDVLEYLQLQPLDGQ